MKKKLILISIFAILFLTIFIIILIVLSRSVPIKYRFYSDDRITGTFAMTVVGAEYNPVDKILEYESEGTQRLQYGYSGFSIKGGKYGRYKISFVIDNKELYKLTGGTLFETYSSNPSLTFQYINTNWWHVTEMTLTAEMILVNDEWIVNTKIIYIEPLENGRISEYTVEKSFIYDEIMKGEGIIQFGV